MGSIKKSISFPEEQFALFEALREAFGNQGPYAATPDRSRVIQDLVDDLIEENIHLLDAETIDEYRDYLDEEGIEIPDDIEGVDTGNPMPTPSD